MLTQIGRFGVANSSTTRFFPRGLRGLRAFSGNPLRRVKLRLTYQTNEMMSIIKLWLECYALKTGPLRPLTKFRCQSAVDADSALEIPLPVDSKNCIQDFDI